jgi:hypothetical protein
MLLSKAHSQRLHLLRHTKEYRDGARSDCWWSGVYRSSAEGLRGRSLFLLKEPDGDGLRDDVNLERNDERASEGKPKLRRDWPMPAKMAAWWGLC